MQEYRNSPMENYSNVFPEERNVQSSPFYGSQKETINFSLLYRCSYILQNSSSFRVSGLGGPLALVVSVVIPVFRLLKCFAMAVETEENLISQRGKAKNEGMLQY